MNHCSEGNFSLICSIRKKHSFFIICTATKKNAGQLSSMGFTQGMWCGTPCMTHVAKRMNDYIFVKYTFIISTLEVSYIFFLYSERAFSFHKKKKNINFFFTKILIHIFLNKENLKTHFFKFSFSQFSYIFCNLF